MPASGSKPSASTGHVIASLQHLMSVPGHLTADACAAITCDAHLLRPLYAPPQVAQHRRLVVHQALGQYRTSRSAW
eukprot:2952530-Rhodomonas_salina.2